jgi:hypothetical protein
VCVCVLWKRGEFVGLCVCGGGVWVDVEGGDNGAGQVEGVQVRGRVVVGDACGGVCVCVSVCVYV